MLKAFSIVYLVIIVMVTCDNWLLELNIHYVNASMAFLSVAFLGLAFIYKERNVLEISILPAALFLFLLYSITSFKFSQNADLSIYPAVKLLSALFLGIALIHYLENIQILIKTLKVVYIAAGILAVSSIIEQFFALEFPFQQYSIPSSRSFFTNPNFFAGYLVLHVPFGVFLFYRAVNLFEKSLLGLSWVLILVALIFSNSQGGQLAAALQVLIMIRYFITNKELDRAKLVGFGLLLSFLIYFVICKFILEPNLAIPVTRVEPEPISPPAFNNIVLRLLYWLGAWRIFIENWLFGSGLWTFMELYPQTGLERSPPHAHNIYLQTAAETGLIGIGLLIACITSLSFKLIHICRKGSAQIAQTGIFIGLSLAGFLLHNISEYNWLTANFIYYFIFLIISVEVIYRETEGSKKWIIKEGSGKVWSKTVLILSILGAYSIFQYYSYQRILSHDIPLTLSMEGWVKKTEEAKMYCESCARPHFLSGMAYLESYRVSKNNQNLILAEQGFTETVRRNPNDMGAQLKLADTKSLLKKYNEAENLYRKVTKDPRYRYRAMSGYLSALKKQRDDRL